MVMVEMEKLSVEGTGEEAQGFGESRFAASRADRWTFVVAFCVLDEIAITRSWRLITEPGRIVLLL